MDNKHWFSGIPSMVKVNMTIRLLFLLGPLFTDQLQPSSKTLHVNEQNIIKRGVGNTLEHCDAWLQASDMMGVCWTHLS